MARLARVLAPGLPHHLTQRGNRRQTVFFTDGDYEACKALAAEHRAAALEAIRKHGRTGRPLGSEAFLEGLEAGWGEP